MRKCEAMKRIHSLLLILLMALTLAAPAVSKKKPAPAKATKKPAAASKKAASARLIQSFGKEGTGPGDFAAPTGIALDSKGNLYVADVFNHRIEVFDGGKGKFIRAFGTEG